MKKATPKEQPQNIQSKNNSINAQQQRLLTALKKAMGKGVTTIQGREMLGVFYPAARVQELRRQQGYNIQALWTTVENAQGNNHRGAARYVLFSGKYRRVA